MKQAHLIAIALLLVLSTPVFANDTSQLTDKEKLSQLRSHIKALREELSRTQALQHDTHSALEQIETHISQQVRLARQVDKKIVLHKNQLNKLRHKKNQLSQQLTEHQERLAQQVKSKYILGRQEYIKLLLNQENPATLSRILTYYDYFNTAHAQDIRSIQQNLVDLKQLTVRITENEKELLQTRERQSTDLQSLQRSKQKRKTVLAQLNKNIAATGTQLKQSLADEKRLLALLDRLAKEQQLPPMESVSYQPFKTLRGQLRWPSTGKIVARYGSKRKDSNLKWKGVMIKAPQGADVTAISHGRVVYANWLRGFGLLMIIDHNNGYMSLYGHNESLFKALGQWVEPNEVIAKVGTSGGYPESGLYFEIRHNGKPTNPAKWCKQ